jgi:hypothetical protein
MLLALVIDEQGNAVGMYLVGPYALEFRYLLFEGLVRFDFCLN